METRASLNETYWEQTHTSTLLLFDSVGMTSNMHSITLWKTALSPNYSTNVDRSYPYSELPYMGDYNLVKIPASLNHLIDHVDYWGEGRILTPQGTRGFSNCYNINHAYQLVSEGSDCNTKIPNRIPIANYSECDNGAYIRDNSVLTVTVMGSTISNSCAADIARLVNRDLGMVIAYGYESNSQDLASLASHLKMKGLYYMRKYSLPTTLQEVTMFQDHKIFLNVNLIKEELFRLITNGDFTEAVYISTQMDNEETSVALSEIVDKLLESNSPNNNKLMSYGYQLWKNGGKNIVSKCFPESFKLIFDSDKVKIVNKGYSQALKLDVNVDKDHDRIVWGDDHDLTSVRVSWQFIPHWVDNRVLFTVYNVDCDMYLKLAIPVDNIGDRQAYGSKDCDSDRHRFTLEPFMKKGSFGFYIINYKYCQGLKLAVSQDDYGDRLVWGHNGDIHQNEDRYKWIISKW